MRVQHPVVTTVLVSMAAFVVFAAMASTPATAQQRPYDTGPDGRPAKMTGAGESFEGVLPDGVESRGDALERWAAYEPDPVKFPVPRTSWDGKPDFSGIYRGTRLAGAPVPLESLYRLETRGAREKAQDPDGLPPLHRCYAPPPSSAGVWGVYQMVSAPGVVLIFDEYMGYHRIISTDGRPHNPSARPSFLGDSIGHWEGDTLVVEVTNFNGKTWHRETGKLPLITSTAMRIVERWSRPDGQVLEYQVVVEDPKMLTAPWQGPRTRGVPFRYYPRALEVDDMIYEQYCVENETLDSLRDLTREYRDSIAKEKETAK